MCKYSPSEIKIEFIFRHKVSDFLTSSEVMHVEFIFFETHIYNINAAFEIGMCAIPNFCLFEIVFNLLLTSPTPRAVISERVKKVPNPIPIFTEGIAKMLVTAGVREITLSRDVFSTLHFHSVVSR